jgi:hypothetical protein
MQISDIKLKEKLNKLTPHLNERQKRIYLSSEADNIGRGGVSLISKLSNVSRPTIMKGKADLESAPLGSSRTRNKGGGRKSLKDKYPDIITELDSLIEPLTLGDPMSPLRWTCKSTRNLAEELQQRHFNISHVVVSNILRDMGYSLQANKKTHEGGKHPDRNKQFEYINDMSKKYILFDNPVISIDTKKKEQIGNYKNNGKILCKEKNPIEVNVYDFETTKAVPYGIYDIDKNLGFVNVGKSYDTSSFAVESIRRWWLDMGKKEYPNSKKILITADSGGSNGSRRKQWKTELQKFANETGMEITVCHFSPGTSKWNKIEHKLFSFISMNWQGKPLESYQTVVNLIGATKTRKGLRVKAVLDENKYEKGIKITNEELEKINLLRHEFHGEWNYTISKNI